MKTMHVKVWTSYGLLVSCGALLLLFFPRFPIRPEVGGMLFLIAGAIYVTAQVVREPNRWRSSSGSLLPVVYLGAFTWFVAGVATAVIFLHRVS